MVNSFKAVLLLSCLFFVVLSHPYHEDKQAKAEWSQFKSGNGRKYDNDSRLTNNTEDFYRFNIWYQRREAVKNHNESWNVTMNKFSDLSDAELKTNYLNLKRNRSSVTPPPIKDFIDKFVRSKQTEPTTPPADSSRILASLPSSVDWRARGKVTPVKDQGYCGSCWAFSTVGSFESLNLIVNSTATNSTANYSEEQQVNCNLWDGGCNGGDPASAMAWAYFNGTTSENSYPYASYDGSMNQGSTDCNSLPKAFQTYGPQSVISYNTTDLMVAVSLQPVVVIVYADYWFSYSGGLFSNCSNLTNQDHAVLLVGYTNDSWIIKNSWGTGWGENGFIRLNRTNPTCGAMISYYANYPLRTKRTSNVDPSCKYYSPSLCTDPNYITYMMGIFFEFFV